MHLHIQVLAKINGVYYSINTKQKKNLGTKTKSYNERARKNSINPDLSKSKNG